MMRCPVAGSTHSFGACSGCAAGGCCAAAIVPRLASIRIGTSVITLRIGSKSPVEPSKENPEGELYVPLAASRHEERCEVVVVILPQTKILEPGQGSDVKRKRAHQCKSLGNRNRKETGGQDAVHALRINHVVDLCEQCRASGSGRLRLAVGCRPIVVIASARRRGGHLASEHIHALAASV